MWFASLSQSILIRCAGTALHGNNLPNILAPLNWFTSHCAYAGGGPDVVTTFFGNDYLVGGYGPDALNAGTGNDTVIGGAGADEISGGVGGTLRAFGGDGPDVIIASGAFSSEVHGGSGNDVITGGVGPDVIYPGAGRDIVRTNGGSDTIVIDDACEIEPMEVLDCGLAGGTLQSPIDPATRGAIVTNCTLSTTPAQPPIALLNLPQNKDVQLSYRLKEETGWDSIDRLRLHVDSLIVNLYKTDVSCEFDSPPALSMLQHREDNPCMTGAELYYATPSNEMLIIERAQAGKPLDFPSLNHLPNGVILDIRLKIDSAQVSIGGQDYTIDVPDIIRREGLKLVPSTRLVPICNDYITSIQLELDAHQLIGSDPRHGKLGAELPALVTAPTLVLSEHPAVLEIPDAVRVTVPPQAVLDPIVMRLRRVDLSDVDNYLSVDFLFRQFMQQVGDAYDFKPDGFEFQRPIEIAMKYDETEYPQAERELALYTFTPQYQIWSPDVPRILREHKLLATAELDSVIAAKESSTDLRDHFPPDYSALPTIPYNGLEIGRINRYEDANYLVTKTNHFCLKSLFADLNVATGGIRSYTPLLDGAFDDVCQLDGFGWVRYADQDVHCGGSLPSPYDIRHAYRKTRRSIDRNGIAVRLRNNLRNHFDGVTCPNSGSIVYCYDLQDFHDDVRWAIEVWREGINRNPDGSYAEPERLRINCWQMDDDDSSCSGDEIDIGLKDNETVSYSYGKNVNISLPEMQRAQAGVGGRVELRFTLLHELGHVLGLWHWAGPGTVMSYQGVHRRNDHKLNVCGTYTQAQLDTPPTPTSVAAGLAQDCQVPELDNRWGGLVKFHSN